MIFSAFPIIYYSKLSLNLNQKRRKKVPLRIFLPFKASTLKYIFCQTPKQNVSMQLSRIKISYIF